MTRTLEEEVKVALKKVLMTKRWNGPPFTYDFKQDAPGLWDDAVAAAIHAVDRWREQDAKNKAAQPFVCPIKHAGCHRFCGSYGCGG